MQIYVLHATHKDILNALLFIYLFLLFKYLMSCFTLWIIYNNLICLYNNLICLQCSHKSSPTFISKVLELFYLESFFQQLKILKGDKMERP